MDDWDKFLSVHKEIVAESSCSCPSLLLIKEGVAPTVIELRGFENGDKLEQGLRKILHAAKPDFYILAVIGWSTEFGEQVYGKDAKYEKIIDMPLDDRERVYAQIAVDRKEGLVKSYMANVDSHGNFVDEETDCLESRFVLRW